MQDSIPITTIYEDGVFRLPGRDLWSCTYRFTDINYLVAGQAERQAMFQRYTHILSALGPGASYKITVNNRHINMTEWESDTLLPLLDPDDGKNADREEYNGMLREQIAGSDGIRQEKYLTVTISKPSLAAARSYFSMAAASLRSAFASIGSQLSQLNAKERLRIFHDFYRPGEEDRFAFDFASAKLGADFRDSIAPGSIRRFPNYLEVGSRFVRVLFAIDYSSWVQDDLINRITSTAKDVMVSVDVITIPKNEAEQEVQLKRDGVEDGITRWQQNQNRNFNFSAVIPYHLTQQREQMQHFMDQLTKNSQEMNLATLTVVLCADTPEQLDADTEALKGLRDCKLICASYQQLPGLQTVLPFGLCRIQAERTMLTDPLAAISMPFRVQEIQEPKGIWFGRNAMSHNMILCNRTNLQNQGMYILGVPGSGKSMFAKILITLLALSSTDHILINDPEGEYAPLVRELGGSVIQIKAGGKDYINAMDMEDDTGTLVDKTQYIQSLFAEMAETPLTSPEQSIIDRCTADIYTMAMRDRKTYTLQDLRVQLLKQPEPEAKRLALILERFTTGSLDVFAHPTNVDTSNRIICFDLHQMQKTLRPAGQMAITNFLVNRVTANSRNGICTHIFVDEIQVFCRNEHSAEFFDNAWRQFRKRNCYPTAITQNVSVVLDSQATKAMLSNSEIVVMLNQSAPDRESLSREFQISDEQMNYVKDSEAGCGLLRYGKSIIPFEARFPTNTHLYRLMTTKPDEGFRGGDAT